MSVTARRFLWLALLASLCGAIFVALAPIGWALNRFVVWLYYALTSIGIHLTIPLVDALLNVAFFALPLTMAALLFRKVPWWAWTVLAFGISAVIELVQHYLLPRHGDVIDLIANTCGGLVASLVSLWLIYREKRQAD